MRQLFPPEIESDSVQPGPWSLPGVKIVDYPRYEWRGAHLDVARHFLTVEEVKRYIDLITLYKINRFHMHLSDDQGWRLWIDDWPNLALIGGSTEVGGGPGGYYNKDDYREIVRYAEDRFITLIPEIDVPGHTDAAEVSYSELNSCRPGSVPSHRLLPGWEDEPFYTGTGVGFSALCVHNEITYEFMADVIREISKITPGPYFHVGGDEAFQTSLPDYVMFMDRIQDITGTAFARATSAQPIIVLPLYRPKLEHRHRRWLRRRSRPHGGGQGHEGCHVACQPHLSRHEIRAGCAPGPWSHLGRNGRGNALLRLEPGAHLTGVTDNNIIGVEAPLWNTPAGRAKSYPRACPSILALRGMRTYVR